MTTLSNLGIKRSATEPTPVATKIAAATLDTKKQLEKTPQEDQESSPKTVSFDLPPPPKMERSRSRSYSRPSPGSVHTRSPSPIRRDRMSSRGRPATRRTSTNDSHSRPSSRSSSRSQTRSPSRRRYRHQHTDQRYPEHQKHTEYQKYPEYPKHTEHQRHTDYDKHTEYQKRPEYTRHSEYTKHPEYTKPQKYQKHHGLFKKSAGFIAGIGLATVLAHKVWPKGVPYGGEEEWERPSRSSKHHHHHHHSHSHSSSGDRHHEHHHRRHSTTDNNPAERAPDHTRSSVHGGRRDSVYAAEETGPYRRGDGRRKSLDPRAFETLERDRERERGEPRRGRPTFREERPRSTVLPYPETPYPDEHYYAPARARAATPAPVASAAR